MGRPKSTVAPKKVAINAGPKLRAYLESLVREEGYGNSPSEVAKMLVWRCVEELIQKDVLKRLPGSE